MKQLFPHTVGDTYHANDSFALSVGHSDLQTDIVMELYHSQVNTKFFPKTTEILDRLLPSIFHSKCFNSARYSFRREVIHTEIGHLFEHILLEYICVVKLEWGMKDPLHNGVTQWDWDTEKRGIFHITIDSGVRDKQILQIALERSTGLLLKIISYK